MINPLIRNDVSIDKLKLIGSDFNQFDKRKLAIRFPEFLRYGDDIVPIGYWNKPMRKDNDLMVMVYADDKIKVEFNPNNVPIKKVDKILKNDWGIHANVMDMDIKRIDLERTRLMDKTLIEYHSLMKYAYSRVKPWATLGTDTMNFGKTSSDKQFTFYTKVPKENPYIVRGEFKILRDATKYDIHCLKHLHDIETLNEIYVKEFDTYMGRKLNKMLHDDNVISIMDNEDDLYRMISTWQYCKENKTKVVPEFFMQVNYDMISYDLWMKFINCDVLDRKDRFNIKNKLEYLLNDSKSMKGNFRLDLIQRDIRNLLKFRDVA
jgi:hypothetical protein